MIKLLAYILILAMCLSGCSSGQSQVRHAERLETLSVEEAEAKALLIQQYNSQISSFQHSYSIERLKCQGQAVCTAEVDSAELVDLNLVWSKHQQDLKNLEAIYAEKRKASESTRAKDAQREDSRDRVAGAVVVLVLASVVAIVIVSDPLDKF